MKDIKKSTKNDDKVMKRYIELVEMNEASKKNATECPDGLYTAICHYDFWINNMLIKYGESYFFDKAFSLKIDF